MKSFSLDLHFTIEREDDVFVATCDELDVASHGDSIEEAVQRCKDAVRLYLEVISEDGELDETLMRRGLVAQPAEAPDGPLERFSAASRVLVSAP